MGANLSFWIRLAAWTIVAVAMIGMLTPASWLLWVLGCRGRRRRHLVASRPAPMPPAVPAAVRSPRKRLHYGRKDGHHFILIYRPEASEEEIGLALLRWFEDPELHLTGFEAGLMLSAADAAGRQCPGCKAD